MTKEKLIAKIKTILKRDIELDFLLNLGPKDLEILLACLMDLIDSERARLQ